MCLRTCVLFLCLYIANSCVDENNQKVDWFVIYKLPEEKKHENKLIENGHAYMYITSNQDSLKWQLSSIAINDTKSMPGLTLSSLYSKPDITRLLYNDDPPDSRKDDELGHTKGVVLSDGESSFWLIHSVPHYPPLDEYSYPKTGDHYGQSFLCISLDLANLNQVGKQLLYNEPNIYNANISPKLVQHLPDLIKVSQKRFIKVAPWYSLTDLTSVQGKKFTSFAKSRAFGKDLYSDWVAPELQTSLDVETWLHGPGRLPSECGKKFDVKNVEKIEVPTSNLDFASERDHSKWAVSTDKRKPWICVGDINRAEHQLKRGGGTVCTNEFPDLWASYYNIVNKTELCNK